MPRTKQPQRQAKSLPLPEPTALTPLPPHTKPFIRHGREAVTYHIPTSPSSPSNPILKTTLSLPRYSTWSSGLHFHTSHTEYLRLVKGCIFITLDGTTKTYSAAAGGQTSLWNRDFRVPGLIIEVPRYARHNWGRAEEYYRPSPNGLRRGPTCVPYQPPDDLEDEVVVEEWTDPSDIAKPLFFWNLNGVITADEEAQMTFMQGVAKGILGKWWIPFQLFVIFWELDNWPAFLHLSNEQTYSVASRLQLCFARVVEKYVIFGILIFVKCLGWLVGVRAVEQNRTPKDLWRAYEHRWTGKRLD